MYIRWDYVRTKFKHEEENEMYSVRLFTVPCFS